MEMIEYQELASRTINTDLKLHEIINHAVLGMNSEAGEIAGIYQKGYQGHIIDVNHVKKELGDLLWFIAEWCSAYNISLEDVAWGNIEKLKKRYPDGFSSARSLNRESGDI